MAHEQVVDYPTFCKGWVAEIEEGSPSTVEKGHRFATKLVNQWIDREVADEVINCDGSGDGGIDIAVLKRGESDDSDVEGDTWYLVQSKYGAAWGGVNTAVSEGIKIVRTLSGKQKRLSGLAREVVERIENFKKKAGENDRIVLVYAKIDPLTVDERQALDEIREFGRSQLGPIFDVEVVTLRMIYDRLADEESSTKDGALTVDLHCSITSSEGGLLVGVTSLVDLYEFLKSYRSVAENLDRIYEHNVRRYLGGGVRVNKEIKKTLTDEPEKFGLYNNGITIVVSDFREIKQGHIALSDPFIVNGCQTTRTIWEVLHTKLGSGGTGDGGDEWCERVQSGVVVTKIAKVGENTEVLNLITRHTNSQNAVRERDFIALDSDFREWQKNLEDKWDLYLEIQRGGWDSRRELQKQNRNLKQLKPEQVANAQELLKVFGAGWLSVPGVAFGKNAPFLPSGDVYRKITEREDNPFGPTDLYAAHLLQKAGEEAGFGRKGSKTSRRQTKYLFAFVVIDLLRDILQKEEKAYDDFSVSQAVIGSLAHTEARKSLITSAGFVIDGYLQQGKSESVFNEEVYQERFGSDLNRFLKWDPLGRDLSKTPNLKKLLDFQKQFMDTEMGDAPSVRNSVILAINHPKE